MSCSGGRGVAAALDCTEYVGLKRGMPKPFPALTIFLLMPIIGAAADLAVDCIDAAGPLRVSTTDRTDRVKNADPAAAEEVAEVEAVPAEVEVATELPPPPLPLPKDEGALVSTRKLTQLPLFRIFPPPPPPLAETTLPLSLGEAMLLDLRGKINFRRRSSDCCRTAVSNRWPSADDAAVADETKFGF